MSILIPSCIECPQHDLLQPVGVALQLCEAGDVQRVYEDLWHGRRVGDITVTSTADVHSTSLVFLSDLPPSVLTQPLPPC
jgi:hypothetical protein